MTQQNPFNNRPPTPKPGQVDEFELMRRRLKQRGATTGQERQQELSRQFASLGNLPSGAAIKTRQKAATASERATNEAMQDINILEAQTLRGEAEAERGRELQRELVGKQLTSQESIATQGFKTDLEKARLAGANALELQNLRNDAALRERELIESGLDARQAETLAQNKTLFDVEMAFKEKGQSFAEKAFKDELTLNKSVTALNAMDLLKANGFSREEIGSILMQLEIPFADQLVDYFDVEQQERRKQSELETSQSVISRDGRTWVKQPGGGYAPVGFSGEQITDSGGVRV